MACIGDDTTTTQTAAADVATASGTVALQDTWLHISVVNPQLRKGGRTVSLK